MARKKRFKYPIRYYLGKQKRKEDFIPFEPVVSKEGANSSLHLPVSIPLKYYHDIVSSKEIDASLLVTIPLQHYCDAPVCTLESLITRFIYEFDVLFCIIKGSQILTDMALVCDITRMGGVN